MSKQAERIVAYVDGELDPASRAAFEAELAADPALREAVAAHRALAEQLRTAYSPVIEEPVPLRLTLAARAANDRPAGRFGAWPWGALAASLVVGVLIGRLGFSPQAPVSATSAGLVARGALAQALTDNLAADAGPIRVGLTFRDGTGRFCRTFTSTADALAGLACRDDGRWRLATTASWTPGAQPEYRMAASALPPAVLAAVDERLAGAPLDAAAERAARDRAWKP